MTDVGDGSQADGSQLRERPSVKPLHLHKSDDVKRKVLELNDQEDRDSKDDKDKRTYGRTPDGTGMLVYATYQEGGCNIMSSAPLTTSTLWC